MIKAYNMKNKIFSFQHTISLSNSDVSGLIYFPKIFDMSVHVLEAFLASSGLPLTECFRRGILMPIVHASANFYLPLRFGDLVQIDLLIDRLGTSSLSLQYQFLNSMQELCAMTNITHVTVDKNNQAESIVIPKELQAIFCSKV